MWVDLADQHIQFAGTQLLLLVLDFRQKVFDVNEHFIIGISNLVQLRIRMQMHLMGKIVAVELRHCPVKYLNGPGNFVGKIHT